MTGGLLVGAVVALVVARVWLDRHGHELAAVLFFVTIFLVVLVNRGDAGDVPENDEARRYRARYSWVALYMLVAFAASIAAHVVFPGFDHWVFLLEALEILGFAAFWVFQTIELGGKITRTQRGTVVTAA